jgi:hypothetical protein
MKIKKSLQALLVILIVLATNPLRSQTNTTYDFLKLDVSARANALAGSYVSATNDVNTIFYNPAGLSTLKETQAAAGFYKYLLDINAGIISYGQRYNDAGYIGGAIRYINYGSFEKYDEESNNIGTFSANEIAISLGYANATESNFHYGVNLKFIYSGIDEYSSTALAGDFGIMYILPKTEWNFALSLLNAGFQLSQYNSTTEDLPLDLRIGLSKKLEHLPLTVRFEFDDLTDNTGDFIDRFKNLSVGGEFDFNEYVKFRIGYDNGQRVNLETGSSIGLAGFSTGIGFKFLDDYAIDYAFNSLGNVGTTNTIDLHFAIK